ncbi:MAG: hypothetical protein M3O67_02205, partial [Bacteroidota bacterium]|nr:hypothetical protein [Bacteroidota bacterium]
LYNGKAGFLGLFDLGRVWQPGEKSNELHTAIGGGIILSPFNKIGLTVTYARSKEEGTFAFNMLKFL